MDKDQIDGLLAVCEEMNTSSRSQPVSALLGAECEAVVRMLAALPVDPDQLSYDATNTQFAQGSLPKALRRSAVVSMRTVRDIVRICRKVVADGPLEGQDGRSPGSRDEPYEALILRLQQAEREVVALKNTAPCLYPSKPGETRAGFSCNGVNVEGSKASIDAVTSWHHAHASTRAWSRAIDEANQRATTAEAKCAGLVEALEKIANSNASSPMHATRIAREALSPILSAKGV